MSTPVPASRVMAASAPSCSARSWPYGWLASGGTAAMRTTSSVINVEMRSSRECAASARRPRLPESKPTSSLRAARVPLAATEAVVIAFLNLAVLSACTPLFEPDATIIPSTQKKGKRQKAEGKRKKEEWIVLSIGCWLLITVVGDQSPLKRRTHARRSSSFCLLPFCLLPFFLRA